MAYDLVYENRSYFISQFKSKYGHTPKQYQKIKQK
ncbi:AraC family transcriptional regulator [Tepidibacter sp. Z1-5]